MSEGKEALTPIAIIKSRDSELMIGHHSILNTQEVRQEVPSSSW